MHTRSEMLDVVMIDGHAKGIVVRNMISGEISRHAAHSVVLATGGYGNVFFLSTNAMGCNVTASYRAYKRGACFANPCFTQIHPTCIPVSGDHQSKLTLMSESLRNDGRVWVPKDKKIAEKIRKILKNSKMILWQSRRLTVSILKLRYSILHFDRDLKYLHEICSPFGEIFKT